MSLWVTLWIVLSAGLVGFFVWSNIALQRQKKAWAGFAQEYDLDYRSRNFFQAAEVRKDFDNIEFQLLSEAQISENGRGRRYVTAFEWIVPAMPANGIIASPEFKPLVDLAQASQVPNNLLKEWRAKDFIRTDDREALQPYLNDKRQKILMKLLNIKGSRFLFAFDRERGVIRIETNDPLFDSKKIGAMYKKVQKMIQELAV